MSNKINYNEEENRLLVCYQAGDENALKQLIRLIHPKIEKVILSSIRKKSAARRSRAGVLVRNYSAIKDSEN